MCVIMREWKYLNETWNVRDKFQDMGNFDTTEMEEIGTDEMTAIVRNIYTLFVELIVLMVGIMAEHGSRNYAADSMPPFLPHQMVKRRGRQFSVIVRLHEDELSTRWKFQYSDCIEQEFQHIQSEYDHDNILKRILGEWKITEVFAQDKWYVQ